MRKVVGQHMLTIQAQFQRSSSTPFEAAICGSWNRPSWLASASVFAVILRAIVWGLGYRSGYFILFLCAQRKLI